MRYLKKIISIFVVAVLIGQTSALVFVYAYNFFDDVPYDYQIDPSSEEWKTYNEKSEILLKLQIPEKKLLSITTSALILTVLDYPYILDYNVFNDAKDAYDTIYSDFNGFRELMSRDDLTENLIDRLRDAKVIKEINNKNNLVADKSFPKEFFKASTLEFLLVCDRLHNGEYSVNQKRMIENLVNEKNLERMTGGLYSANSNIYTKYTKQSINNLNNIYGIFRTVSSSVTTPNGSRVATLYDRTPELTTAEKNAMYQAMASQYPSATYLRSATVKYNCHSYAWYSQSSTNKHWMNDPSKYMTDGSYYRYTTSPRGGMKAYWTTDGHSGIVSKITYTGGVHTYYTTSKWGSYGLYEHVYTNCPYSGTVHFYARSGS